VKYLTAEQVLFIHARLIAETGGSHGIRDLGLLQSAIARPQATFDKQDLYSDVFFKAGALMKSLLQNHPFVDGNKRTAITSAAIFLRMNGYRLMASNTELEQFTFSALLEHLPVVTMAAWFEVHVVKG
jgi:death on curing protein